MPDHQAPSTNSTNAGLTTSQPAAVTSLVEQLLDPLDTATADQALSLFVRGAVMVDYLAPKAVTAFVDDGANRYRVNVQAEADGVEPPQGTERTSPDFRSWHARCGCAASQSQRSCRHSLAVAMAVDAADDRLPPGFAARAVPGLSSAATGTQASSARPSGRATGIAASYGQASPAQAAQSSRAQAPSTASAASSASAQGLAAKLKPGERARSKELARLRAATEGLDRGQLRLLLLAAAEASDETRRALLERCAHFADDDDAQLAALEALLKRAGALKGIEAKRYADRLSRADALIDEKLGQREFDLAFALAEEALKRGNAALVTATDGSGALSSAVTRLQTRWCEVLAALRDPWTVAQKARRYVETTLGQPVHSEGFSIDPLSRSSAGMLDALAQVSEEKLAKLRDKHGNSDARTVAARQLAQRIADARHDVDAWLTIESHVQVDRRDLDGMLDRLIAAGRTREAIQLAEQTLRRERLKTPDALRARLAKMYWDDGLDDEALQLLWDNFAAGGDVPAWRAYKHYASRKPDWLQLRQRGLDHVLALERSRALAQDRPSLGASVALHLEEGLIEQAQALAAQGKVTAPIRARLALALAPKQPLAAVQALRDVFREWLLSPYVSPSVHADIADLLEKTCPPATQAEAHAAWAALLHELRNQPRLPRHAQQRLADLLPLATPLNDDTAPRTTPPDPSAESVSSGDTDAASGSSRHDNRTSDHASDHVEL